MVRGRSIDKTLPSTRALTQQRDYRARKAQREKEILDENARLREDNRRLIEENNRLRVECDASRWRIDELEKRLMGLEASLRGGAGGTGSAETWYLSEVDKAREEVDMAFRRLERVQRASMVAHATPESMPSPPNVIASQGRCCPGETRGCGTGSAVEVAAQAMPIQGYNPPLVAAPVIDYIPSTDLRPLTGLPPSAGRLDEHSTRRQSPINGPDVDLPSFRPGYPQSNEREECCLGLISCEPTVAE